jgi:hypothetical protein
MLTRDVGAEKCSIVGVAGQNRTAPGAFAGGAFTIL